MHYYLGVLSASAVALLVAVVYGERMILIGLGGFVLGASLSEFVHLLNGERT